MSMLHEAEDKGRQKGIQKGMWESIQEEMLEWKLGVPEKLTDKNISLAKVAEITGPSVAKIQIWQAESQHVIEYF